MKNSPLDRPRFTCRVVRGCLSIFGDTSTGEPRGPGAAHVAACADCQQFFGACNELDVALRRDAAREWREAPANLEQNIIRAVNQSKPEPATHGARGAWMSFAAVAACAVAVTLVYQYRTPTSSTPLAPDGTTVDPAMVAAAQQLIAAVPTDLFSQMQPRAEAILQQDPLQKEVEAMKSDARTAARFLARNFLPTSADEIKGGE